MDSFQDVLLNSQPNTKFIQLMSVGAAGLLIIAGFLQFFQFTFRDFIVSIYAMILGGCAVSIEYAPLPVIDRYARFLNTFLGRGLVYFFFGILCWGGALRLIISLFLVILGIVFITFEFLPNLEPSSGLQPRTEFSEVSDEQV